MADRRSFHPTDVEARIGPFSRRAGYVARATELVIVSVLLKHLRERLTAADVVSCADPRIREVLTDTAAVIAANLHPACVYVGWDRVCALFLPEDEYGQRTYGGRTSALLSAVSSLAGVGALQAASAHLPALITSMPREQLQFCGIAYAIPSIELAEDWAVREELLYEQQLTLEVAKRHGIRPNGVGLATIRDQLVRQSREWRELQEGPRRARFGGLVKPLPSSEQGVWEAVDLPDSVPCLRALVEEGKLGALLRQRYNREDRQLLYAGTFPPIK